VTYIERAPPQELRDHVETLWSYEGAGGSIERIVPDGRCELVIQLRGQYRELTPAGSWRLQPPILFAGQLTRPLWLESPAAVSVVSARLRPDSTGLFLGASAADLTDRRIALGVLRIPRASTLRMLLRKGLAVEPACKTLCEFLIQRFRQTSVADLRVARIVSALDAGGEPSLRRLAARERLSTRQVQRLFARHVGIPPRLYLRIRRFRRVFDVFDEHRSSWAVAAADAGYFDQPELARDFRRFVGCTARQVHASRLGLTAGLVLPRAMSQ
jgi:AraC-like DNA-binding protein